MRLIVRHTTTYAYDPPASRVALRLRLFPSVFEGQSIERWQITVNGERVERLLTDGFGDGLGLWFRHHKCERAEIVAEGVVVTEDRAGVVKGLRRRPPPSLFLHETKLTKPDAAIRDLARSIEVETELGRLHALSAAVHEALTYKPGVTTAKTTAADALRLGAGVCQDHAHIFISAARSLGCPARYVTGYLLANTHEEVEIATHAWAEAFVEGIGWIGFDPSNKLSPTDTYVRLAAGMDAVASAPVRGAFSGESEVTLTARVEIDDADVVGELPSQSQSQTQVSAGAAASEAKPAAGDKSAAQQSQQQT